MSFTPLGQAAFVTEAAAVALQAFVLEPTKLRRPRYSLQIVRFYQNFRSDDSRYRIINDTVATIADHHIPNTEDFSPRGKKAFVTAYSVTKLRVSRHPSAVFHQRVSKEYVLDHNSRLIPPVSSIPPTLSLLAQNPFCLYH